MLQSVADTLRKVGAAVTVSQLERAVMADLGYPEAMSAQDDLAGVLARAQNLSYADQLRLIHDVAGGLVA